jgi:hypothetical protein
MHFVSHQHGYLTVGTNDAQPPGKQERSYPRLDPTGMEISSTAIQKTTTIEGLAKVTMHTVSYSLQAS